MTTELVFFMAAFSLTFSLLLLGQLCVCENAIKTHREYIADLLVRISVLEKREDSEDEPWKRSNRQDD